MVKPLEISTLNLQDALDLAVLIEKQAEERYRMFVDLLGQDEAGSAADFFAMMARNEHRHAVLLLERRRALFGDAPARVTEDMIDDDIEAPSTGKPRPYMSPRHALEVAMESEIKAYEFFAQALPQVQDSEVHKLFEELRDDELKHQQLVEQQKAKYPASMEPDVVPEDVDTPAL